MKTAVHFRERLFLRVYDGGFFHIQGLLRQILLIFDKLSCGILNDSVVYCTYGFAFIQCLYSLAVMNRGDGALQIRGLLHEEKN